MDADPNHDEARIYAEMHVRDSNLARCYLDLLNCRAPFEITEERIHAAAIAIMRSHAIQHGDDEDPMTWADLSTESRNDFRAYARAALAAALNPGVPK